MTNRLASEETRGKSQVQFICSLCSLLVRGFLCYFDKVLMCILLMRRGYGGCAPFIRFNEER